MPQLKNLEEIQECHLVSGDFDYLLKPECLICLPTGHYLVKPCFACRGVNDTRTYVVMEEVKQSNRLVIKTR